MKSETEDAKDFDIEHLSGQGILPPDLHADESDEEMGWIGHKHDNWNDAEWD